ncbi:hypothetical protein VU13_02195 [Desulfobulbus sp. US5]|nr:hypothetical protein [Desulfobulbus sp. US4]MCW5214125.1 hypothetical protein [Desulfobulbus sp. US5]
MSNCLFDISLPSHFVVYQPAGSSLSHLNDFLSGFWWKALLLAKQLYLFAVILRQIEKVAVFFYRLSNLFNFICLGIGNSFDLPRLGPSANTLSTTTSISFVSGSLSPAKSLISIFTCIAD